MPHCWIVAGPNGAGKTTFALNFLPKVAKSKHFIGRRRIMNSETPALSKESLLMLETLREAVAQALDRKRKLGEYAVLWRDGKVVFEGEDAPKQS